MSNETHYLHGNNNSNVNSLSESTSDNTFASDLVPIVNSEETTNAPVKTVAETENCLPMECITDAVTELQIFLIL